MRQRKYYEAKDVLITNGLVMLGSVRFPTSAIASVQPFTQEEFSWHWRPAVWLGFLGLVLIIVGFSISNPARGRDFWITGCLMEAIAATFAAMLTSIKWHAVRVTLLNNEYWTFSQSHARSSQEFADRISQAMAER